MVCLACLGLCLVFALFGIGLYVCCRCIRCVWVLFVGFRLLVVAVQGVVGTRLGVCL